jgi:hypothetical protein
MKMTREKYREHFRDKGCSTDQKRGVADVQEVRQADPSRVLDTHPTELLPIAEPVLFLVVFIHLIICPSPLPARAESPLESADELVDVERVLVNFHLTRLHSDSGGGVLERLRVERSFLRSRDYTPQDEAGGKLRTAVKSGRAARGREVPLAKSLSCLMTMAASSADVRLAMFFWLAGTGHAYTHQR